MYCIYIFQHEKRGELTLTQSMSSVRTSLADKRESIEQHVSSRFNDFLLGFMVIFSGMFSTLMSLRRGHSRCRPHEI